MYVMLSINYIYFALNMFLMLIIQQMPIWQMTTLPVLIATSGRYITDNGIADATKQGPAGGKLVHWSGKW